MTSGASIHDIARSILQHLEGDAAAARGYDVIRRDQHSNDVDEIHLEDGRILIVKRAPVPAMASRFRVSRLAADLVRRETDLRAPEYLRLPEGVADEEVLVYWWLPYPTLDELLPGVPDARAKPLLTEWGRATRSIHGIRLAGHGDLETAVSTPRSLLDFLRADLEERLHPAALATWPEGTPSIPGLLEVAADLFGADEPPAVLVHNDLFEKNLLWSEIGIAPSRCVGVLDFEDAFAGPPAADLARTEVLHGPLFGSYWPGDWFDSIREGYGEDVAEAEIACFRTYSLLNMGYFAAATGLREHAVEVARAAALELDALGDGRRHAAVLGAD